MNPLDATTQIQINYKKINVLLLAFVLLLFGYYIYQTNIISSGNIVLVNLKKDLIARKDSINSIFSETEQSGKFSPAFVRENLKMVEIQGFDYLILGPSEFALIKENGGALR